MKRFLIIICVCQGLLFSVDAQSVDTLATINKIFSEWNNSTPGASVLVAQGNQIIYHKAFGLADLEHNVPNTTETIFESGSVAKQFTAAAILLLASEGKLSISDDVRKHVPELPVYEAPIKIYHLLHHTSGLKDWGVIGGLTGWPRTTRVYTQELALQIICKQKSLNFKPGDEYSYSNSNYSLLVTIVERVSKQSLADFTHARFFEPLQMTSTQWRDNFSEVVANRSIAYSRSGNEFRQNMPFENVHGHGGLLTTTGDLLKWNSLLETRSIGGDQVYNLRVEKGKLNNGREISYAAGISVSDNFGLEISHSGATAGYRTWLAYYPRKKITIILLSNDGGSNVVRKGYEIANLLMGKPADDKVERKPVSLSETDLKRFVGTYKSTRDFDVFNIELKEGKPYVDESELQALHRDTLFRNNNKWVLVKPAKILLLYERDTITYTKVPWPDTTPNSLKAVAGNYYSEEAEASYTIEVRNNEVWVINKPFPAFKLKPSFQNGFFTEDYTLFEFKPDKKGIISRLEVSLPRAERVTFVRRK